MWIKIAFICTILGQTGMQQCYIVWDKDSFYATETACQLAATRDKFTMDLDYREAGQFNVEVTIRCAYHDVAGPST